MSADPRPHDSRVSWLSTFAKAGWGLTMIMQSILHFVFQLALLSLLLLVIICKWLQSPPPFCCIFALLCGMAEFVRYYTIITVAVGLPFMSFLSITNLTWQSNFCTCPTLQSAVVILGCQAGWFEAQLTELLGVYLVVGLQLSQLFHLTSCSSRS